MDTEFVFIPQNVTINDLRRVCDRLDKVENRTIAVVNNLDEQILIGEVSLYQIRRMLENNPKDNGHVMLSYKECPLLLELYLVDCLEKRFNRWELKRD